MGGCRRVPANSDLKSSEYAVPVLGLIFLRYADHRFTIAEKELEGKGSGRRKIGKEDYQAKGVMYVPPEARFSHLLSLPEGENIGKAINEAMKSVEAENVDLKGVLPRTYTKIDNAILVSLLKNFSRSRWMPKATRSARFTNTSLATSPVPKGNGAVSSSRRPRWSS